MVAAPKGKQGTKGAKQIVEENVATLNFYRNMALGGTAAFLLITLIFSDLFRGLTLTMFILTSIAHAACYYFMAFMSQAKLSEGGAVMDSGTDLNMEGGLAEHVKDMIILTTGTQVLSLISNYFWLLWLLAPARAFHLAWGSLIQPWFQSRKEQQQEPEVNDKKQKKLDRKMRRMR